GALRPQFLVAVRETVREWAADEGIRVVLPELRKPTGGRGLRAAMSGTPERRQLAERAFQDLPGASQCILWHTEAEAEPITVTAALLGVDTIAAVTALEQSREQFRTGLVRAHRELAPTAECRFYNRLLDVSIRREGSLSSDVQRHLTECRHCGHAAEQLGHFGGGLGVLLAESVLGWGARRYLDSRPGRGTLEERPPAPEPVHPAAVGRPAVPEAGVHRPASGNGRRTALAVGVGLTLLALLATVLGVTGRTGGGSPETHATWRVGNGGADRPGAVREPSAGASPSAAFASEPVEFAHGRLRGAVSRLCPGLEGGRAEAGARTVLAACTSAGSRQWSHRDGGLP
ncbi:hydrolase, partial [Streptomyces sp. NPDC058964]